MAKMMMNGGFAGGSGRLGNAVLLRTEGGQVLRARMAWINLALGFEQAEAWRAYGAAEGRKGYAAFVALGSKYLQLHGGTTVPIDPPAEPFLGDIVRVSGVAEAGGCASRPTGRTRRGPSRNSWRND